MKNNIKMQYTSISLAFLCCDFEFKIQIILNLWYKSLDRERISLITDLQHVCAVSADYCSGTFYRWKLQVNERAWCVALTDSFA